MTNNYLKAATPQCKHQMEDRTPLNIVVFGCFVIPKLLTSINKPATNDCINEIKIQGQRSIWHRQVALNDMARTSVLHWNLTLFFERKQADQID